MAFYSVADPFDPRPIGFLSSGGKGVHRIVWTGGRYAYMSAIVDVSDEQDPRVLGICPPPQGDFCNRGLRSGPHNLHENRPGSDRSAEVLFTTYFNAGLRVYHVADPSHPVEIAHWVPPVPPRQPDVQINDVFVDAREASGPTRLTMVEGRNHVVNNKPYAYRPQTADWLADLLDAHGGRKAARHGSG